MKKADAIISSGDVILVTGAAGFIGQRVLASLLSHGFANLRLLARSSGTVRKLEDAIRAHGAAGKVKVILGDLLSADDCQRAAGDAVLIYHLAAGRGDFAGAYRNSVDATRNLLQATSRHGCLKRFVNVSSFSVYSNRGKANGTLDESCAVETEPADRGDPYTFGKVKQDELVVDYGKQFNLPYVIVRPGWVYGPGNEAVSNRVGIHAPGLFLHLGGSNRVPLTYVDNCADAIVLAGLTPGVDGEIFNVVDDDLPSSRGFVRLYRENVTRLRSIYIPHFAMYILCCFWEKCSRWSNGALPLKFNRKSWYAFWKQTSYTNAKLKERLGWSPRISTSEGLNRYFESCRINARRA